MRKWILGSLVLVASAVALAQPYYGTPTFVCNGMKETSTLTNDGGAVPVPATPLTQRISILICNGSENSAGLIKCCVGTDCADAGPTMGASNKGMALNVGDCMPYNLTAGTIVYCRSNTSASYASSFECRN
jgi:hypothetical protein